MATIRHKDVEVTSVHPGEGMMTHDFVSYAVLKDGKKTNRWVQVLANNYASPASVEIVLFQRRKSSLQRPRIIEQKTFHHENHTLASVRALRRKGITLQPSMNFYIDHPEPLRASQIRIFA